MSHRRLSLIFTGISFCAAAAAFGPSCGPSSQGGSLSGLMPDLKPAINDPNVDHDGDHQTVASGDCNDYDPLTFKGAKEVCFDHKDQNCDGVPDEQCDDDKDGYAIVAADPLPGGDCDDGNPFVSPGAFEVVGNNADDNCDGKMDEVTPTCDVNLAPTAQDAMTFASSMDLCAPWLQSATWNRFIDVRGKKITNHFGQVYKPQAGQTMAFFSTGIAADRGDGGFTDPQPGYEFFQRDMNPLPITSKNICTNLKNGAPTESHDMIALTLKIKAPSNATGFKFKLNFFSAEYPEYVGNQYNDMFIAYLQSKKFTGNISFDGNGEPVTVNSGFFQVCDSSPICANGGHTCTKGPKDLDGTGYEIFAKNGERYGGGTGWLTTSKAVEPGEVFTLTLYVFDSGDYLFDSAVLLDGFEWLFDESIKEGTIPG